MVKSTLSLVAAAATVLASTSTAFQPISNVASSRQILNAPVTTPLFMSDDGGVSALYD